MPNVRIQNSAVRAGIAGGSPNARSERFIPSAYSMGITPHTSISKGTVESAVVSLISPGMPIGLLLALTYTDSVTVTTTGGGGAPYARISNQDGR